MKHITEQELDRLCKQAAGRYGKVWWADPRDLQAEAAVAVLSADGTFDAARGVPFRAYAWRAAMLHLRSYLLRAGSPVSGRSRPERMVGMHHAPIEEADGHVSDAPSPEDALARARWARTVRVISTHLLAWADEAADDTPLTPAARAAGRASLALRSLHNNRPH